jgi:hypothetical protein
MGLGCEAAKMAGLYGGSRLVRTAAWSMASCCPRGPGSLNPRSSRPTERQDQRRHRALPRRGANLEGAAEGPHALANAEEAELG